MTIISKIIDLILSVGKKTPRVLSFMGVHTSLKDVDFRLMQLPSLSSKNSFDMITLALTRFTKNAHSVSKHIILSRGILTAITSSRVCWIYKADTCFTVPK